jgi:hypothetical protein
MGEVNVIVQEHVHVRMSALPSEDAGAGRTGEKECESSNASHV